MEKRLIEFIGLPGSGKTSMAFELVKKDEKFRLLKKDRRSYKTPIWETVNRHFLAFFFIVRRPLFSLSFLRFLIATEQNSLNDFRAVAINFFYKISFYPLKKKGSFLLDEGVFHAVLSILISSRNKDFVIENVLDFIPSQKHWILIYVNNDINTTLDRLKKRNIISGKKHRISSLNLENNLQILVDHFESLLEKSIEKKKIKLISVENIDLDSSVYFLLNEIQKQVSE